MFTLRLMLLIASFGVPLFADPAPGGTASPKKPGFTLEDLKAQIPQNREGRFLMEVPQLLNTTTDPEVQGLLAGQGIETTGQVMPEVLNNRDGKRLRIFRAEVLCCSAHARECSVELEFPQKAPELKVKSWVKVAGTLSFKNDGVKNVPVVLVKEIEEIAAPANPKL